MNHISLLSLVTFLPLVFAAAVLLLPRDNAKLIRYLALFGTLATLAVSLVICSQFSLNTSNISPTDHASLFQMAERHAWMPNFGINYYLGIDGVSLLLVLMTTVIFPFAVGVSFSGIKERTNQFYAWMLIMETAVLGVFLSINMVMFYVFWEAMLVPMFFIIGIWGGPKRVYATVKFFIYTMVGSMVMLVSMLALYFMTGQVSFDLPVIMDRLPAVLAQYHAQYGSDFIEILLFIGFFLAFGIKAPVWPFHTWVPDAYSEAPTGGSIILVALKMGLYGFIRFCIPLFPNAVHDCAPWIVILSVIGVVYAALVAAMQTDLKKLIAYSSVSHVGVIMLAIFAGTSVGINGAVLQMVSHTITTGALFIIVGGLIARRGSSNISDYGGLMRKMPGFTVIFLIAVLSSVALPLTAGFSGEILMLIGSFQTYPVATAIATTSAVWSVVYMLWMFQRVMYGPVVNDDVNRFHDTTTGEYFALAPLVLAIFVLGIFPSLSTNLTKGAVTQILGSYQQGLNPANGGTNQTANAQPMNVNTLTLASAAMPKGNR